MSKPDLSGETPSARAHRVGIAKAKFNAIRVDYPPQTSAIALLDEVRIAALKRKAGAACDGAMLIAPTGCGKTEAILALQRILSSTAEESRTPLLHVMINTAGTTDSVPTSILQALRVARPDAGSEKSRWPRAIDEIQRSGVELIVFDEFNRAARRQTMSGPIANAIQQHILDAGIAPAAFVGSEDAANVLKLAPALMERLGDDIDLSPLRWESPGDRELFVNLVSDLDAAMVDAGIMACLSGLAEENTARPLWEASAGRVRRISRIVRHAMATALRDGREAIYRHDLAEAVDAYCIPRDYCKINPFGGAN